LRSPWLTVVLAGVALASTDTKLTERGGNEHCQA
jgi:hypothetical protein